MKNKNTIISVIGLTTMLIALIGATFAFFVANVSGNDSQEVNLQASSIDELYYSADSAVTLTNVIPGKQDVKTFTVQNKSTKNTLQYNMYLVIDKNTFNDTDGANQLVFNFASSSSVESKTVPIVSTYDVTGKLVNETTSNEDRRVLLVSRVRIVPQEIHSYTVTLKFNDINRPQDNNKTAEFSGYFTIDNSITSVPGEIIKSVKKSAKESTSTMFSAVEPSNTISSVKDDNFSKPQQTYTVDTIHQDYYMTYADNYTFNTPTEISDYPTYTLTEPQVGKYSEIYNLLPGNYIVNYEGHNDPTAAYAGDLTISPKTGLDRIYKVVSATENSITYIPSSYTTTFTNNGTAGVYTIEDENNTTSYYYRGNVTNNYVKFGKWNQEVYRGYNSDQSAYKEYFTPDECQAAGTGYTYTYGHDCNKSPVAGKDMYWRIVRINGDGTLRLMYDGTEAHANGTKNLDRFALPHQVFNTRQDNNAYVGYMYGDINGTDPSTVHANTNPSAIKTVLEEWYTNNFVGTEYASKVGNMSFCNDRSRKSGTGIGTSETRYGTWERLYTNKSPSLICPQKEKDLFTSNASTQGGNGELNKPVGLLTADEVALAGGVWGKKNRGYYINKGNYYWLGSPYSYNSYAYEFSAHSNGSLDAGFLRHGSGAVPVINLSAEAANILVGTGTMEDPYTVN